MISYFLPLPTAIIYVIAGWAGMRLITFLILDVLGALLWAGMLAGLGYAIGHPAVSVAKTISHYGLYFTIALVVVVIFFQMRAFRASPGGPSASAPSPAPSPAPATVASDENAG